MIQFISSPLFPLPPLQARYVLLRWYISCGSLTLFHSIHQKSTAALAAANSNSGGNGDQVCTEVNIALLLILYCLVCKNSACGSKGDNGAGGAATQVCSATFKRGGCSPDLLTLFSFNLSTVYF